MNTMRVLNEKGDITVEWNPDDPESVAKARAEYDRLKEDGYEFYEVEEKKGKRVKRWDKNRSKIIAAPGVKTGKDKATGKRPKAQAGGPNSRLVV